jgi:hypothetical protein
LKDPRLFSIVDELIDIRRDEAICLSWAASILQAHKKQWNWATAVQFGTDGGVAFGAAQIESAFGAAETRLGRDARTAALVQPTPSHDD